MTPESEHNTEQIKAMAALSPYLARFDYVLRSAVLRFNEDTAARSIAGYDNRAICAAISCNIWNTLEEELAEVPGCHLLRIAGGLRVLNISDTLVLRFKKVDENGRHRNAETKQQQRFDAQLPLEGLPDPAIRLVVGYQPDEAFSDVERVIIRCPKTSWAAQVVICEETPNWSDITPRQFPLVIDTRDRKLG